MADPRLASYARQFSSPRVETHPTIDLIQVEYAVPATGHVHLFQRTGSTKSPASDTWIIAMRPYLTWCIIVDKPMTLLLEVEGDDLIVVGGFAPVKAFPLFDGIQNELTRYYIPGFLAKLTVYNSSVANGLIGGMIKLEGA